MSEFQKSLQHHLSQTRAGLYGQFEHSFNFNQGTDQNPDFLLGRGESITFTGALVSGEALVVTVTNDLTGPSGKGFQAAEEVPESSSIVVGDNPETGQATLDFEALVGGAPGNPTITFTRDVRTPQGSDSWRSIQPLPLPDNCTQLLIRNQGNAGDPAYDIVREDIPADGSYFIVGGFGVSNSVGNRRSVAELSTSGARLWNAGWDEAPHRQVVHDPTSDFVVAHVQGNHSTSRTIHIPQCRGYDRSIGLGVGFPAALGNETWTTFFDDDIRFGQSRIHDMVASGDGFVYVVLNRNSDTYDGATPGTFKSLFKLNAATGAIVETYLIPATSAEIHLAVNSLGELIVAKIAPVVPEDGGTAANTFRFDSDLTLLARYDADFDSDERHVAVTTDADDNIYLVSKFRTFIKLESTLTTEISVTSPLQFGTFVVDIGHDGTSAGLWVSQSNKQPRNRDFGQIRLYDNDGVFVKTCFDATAAVPRMHVNAGSGPPINVGQCFTTEFSTTPPGKRPAVACVKYAQGNITDIYFNSCEEFEIDPAAWNDVQFHSAAGDFPFGTNGQWEYHSPL